MGCPFRLTQRGRYRLRDGTGICPPSFWINPFLLLTQVQEADQEKIVTYWYAVALVDRPVVGHIVSRQDINNTGREGETGGLTPQPVTERHRNRRNVGDLGIRRQDRKA